MTTEADHLAAVLTLMGAASADAYGLGELDLMTSRPTFYNEVHVMERLGSGPRRTSVPAESRQWRVLVRSIGEVYANAQEMRSRAALLHEATLVVAGQTYYLERATSDDPIGPDDGWWSGVTEYRY